MRAVHREGLTVFLALAGLLLSMTAAAGGRGVFLPPSGCLPADGGPALPFHLFVWDRPSAKTPPDVRVSTGETGPVKHLGGGLYRFDYRPARGGAGKTLTLSSRAVRARADVALCADPAGRLEVQVEPDHLLAGAGQKAFLRIRALSPAQEPLTGLNLQLTTNVGRVEKIEELGGGKYRAVYVPPGDPFPQVGIVMVANPDRARLERVAAARVVIPITARVELPGKTDPGTRMQMSVAGRRFGPVKAGRDGRFEIPILVPPGYGKGLATSIDRAGNRRTRKVDLFLPETNQLGLWAYPLKLPADGTSRSRLLVTTIDRFGAPADLSGRRAGVDIRAELGRVSPLQRLAKGLYEAYYTAPAAVGQGRDRIRVQFPGGGSKSRAEVSIALLPGPPAKVELRGPDLLAADGHSRGELTVRIVDASGNPVGGRKVDLTADEGRVAVLSEPRPGEHLAELVVDPDPLHWVSQVTATVSGGGGAEPAQVLIDARSLRRDQSGQAQLVACLVDDLGRPVPGAEVGLACTGQPTRAETGPHGRARFDLPDSEGSGPTRCLVTADQGRIERSVFWHPLGGQPALLPIGLAEALPPDEPLVARTTVRLHPPLAVRLSIRAERPAAGRAWRVEIRVQDSSGAPAGGRKVALSASAGDLGPAREAEPGLQRATWTPPAAGWRRCLLSAVDVASGVGAALTLSETAPNETAGSP